MNILHTSFECYPIAKVGGLADVVGALPKYQNKLGVNTSVITPFYSNLFIQKSKLETVYTNVIRLAEVTYTFSIKKILSQDLGFDAYLVYIEGLLDRPNVYNYIVMIQNDVFLFS